LNHQDTKITKNPQRSFSVGSSLITIDTGEMKTNTGSVFEGVSNTQGFLGVLGGLVVNRFVMA